MGCGGSVEKGSKRNSRAGEADPDPNNPQTKYVDQQQNGGGKSLTPQHQSLTPGARTPHGKSIQPHDGADAQHQQKPINNTTTATGELEEQNNIRRDGSFQTDGEDPTLDRKDSISRLTDEPGEITASLRLKYRVMKARITNDITDDVDQFNDEIAESFPTLREKEIRRINKWREECAMVHPLERIPVPLDSFFFPTPSMVSVSSGDLHSVKTQNTTIMSPSQYYASDVATVTDSTAGNSITDPVTVIHHARPAQQQQQTQQMTHQGVVVSGEAQQQQQKQQQQAQQHYNYQQQPQHPHEPIPVVMASPNSKVGAPVSPQKHLAGFPSTAVGNENGGVSPGGANGAARNGAVVGGGEGGLFEFVSNVERATPQTASSSKNASRNANPDDSRMMSDLMDFSTTSNNPRTPHSPLGGFPAAHGGVSPSTHLSSNPNVSLLSANTIPLTAQPPSA